MPNTSNCRLQITNGPSDKWEFSGFRTEGSVWPKLEAKITECPLWIFDIRPFLLKLPYYHQKMYLVFDIVCFYKFYIFLHDNGQVYLS